MSLQINTQPVQFSSFTKFQTLTASIFHGASGLKGTNPAYPNAYGGAGGYILLNGGNGSINLDANGGNGGYIDLRGSEGGSSTDGGNGGCIIMTGSEAAPAGWINTSASGYRGVGGSIDTRGYGEDLNGGNINTSAAAGGSGGDINTSSNATHSGGYICTTASIHANGGYINTIGGGYINTGGANSSYGFGGYIKTCGGVCELDGPDPGGGGYINTSGHASSILGGFGGNGGFINTTGSHCLDGGSINTSGGGSINTSGSIVRKLTISGATISDANGDYYSYDNGVTWDNDDTGYEIVFSAHATNDLDGKLYSDNHLTLLYQATAVDNLFNVANWDIYFGNSGTPFSSIVDNSYQILGGIIDTSNGGGDILTKGYEGIAGGSINTSGGGGSINTTGSGYIQFGYNTFRTILSGTATQNRNINLPDASGTLVIATTGIKLGSLQEVTSVSGTLSTFQLTNSQGTVLGYIPVYPTAS